MPAVAIPAAISLVGMAASAVGAHKAQNAQKKADAARKASISSVVDENYRNNVAYQQANQGRMDSIFAGASGPQTSSSTSYNDEDSTETQDYGPEGNAARANMLQAANNQPWEVNNLLAQQRESINRNISGQQRGQDTAIRNAAASRGVDPGLMRIGANQGINAQRLDADLGVAQQAQTNKRQAWGDIGNVLGLYKSTNRKTKSRGGGTQTGGPDYGTMMAAINYGAPVQKEVVV
jgi:hypothetical protein